VIDYSILNEIVDLIKSPELQRELLPAKLVFMFFSVLFFAEVVYLLFTSSYLKYQFATDFKFFLNWQSATLQRIAKRWKKIQKRMGTRNEYEYKLAVIEADDLFRDILEEKGFKGKTFEEKVKQIEEADFPNLEEVLEVHKIRNSVVYDPNYKLDFDQTKQALGVYEKAIKNMESA